MGNDGMRVPELYLCIHIAEFPAQARLRLRVAGRADAVVILDGNPPLQFVCSANRKAYNLGVTRGLTRAQLDSFLGLTLLNRSHAEERSGKDALLGLAAGFTPRAQVLPTSDESLSLVLDIGGSDRLLGKVDEAAIKVLGAVGEIGVVARVSISWNFHTAVCLAPFAKMKPIIVPQGAEDNALHALPVQALQLRPEQHETFDLWGIRTVGELTRLNEKDLVVRMGQEGKRLWLLAHGKHPHLFRPEDPPETLEERITFDDPVEQLESLLFVMGPMLDQLITRAGQHALAIGTVTVRLTLSGAASSEDASEPSAPGQYERFIKPALPVTDRALLLKLIHLDMEAHPPGAAVAAITLVAEAQKRGKVQMGLFQAQSPEPSRLDVTLARLTVLVGEDRVGRIRLLDTQRSDGFVMERFTTTQVSQPPPHAANAANIAIRRKRPPVTLRMQTENGRPARFWMEGQRYQIHEAKGPWRRSGHWWSAEVWSREEWDAQASTADAQTLACLLVHDSIADTWLLDALYD
jgi:protein ImuB